MTDLVDNSRGSELKIIIKPEYEFRLFRIIK